MMRGMQSLSAEEMREVRGGYCETIGGYVFCCPASSADLRYLSDAYLKESQEKASMYIRFVYQCCDWKNLH